MMIDFSSNNQSILVADQPIVINISQLTFSQLWIDELTINNQQAAALPKGAKVEIEAVAIVGDISDEKCLRTFMMKYKKYIQFWWKSENWYNYDAKLKAETFLMQNEKIIQFCKIEIDRITMLWSPLLVLVK